MLSYLCGHNLHLCTYTQTLILRMLIIVYKYFPVLEILFDGIILDQFVVTRDQRFDGTGMKCNVILHWFSYFCRKAIVAIYFRLPLSGLFTLEGENGCIEWSLLLRTN